MLNVIALPQVPNQRIMARLCVCDRGEIIKQGFLSPAREKERERREREKEKIKTMVRV
jgi:hypothetical protein